MIREEGGTPEIVGSIRAGLVFALKEQVGAEEIRRRERDFARRALASWGAEPADRDPRQHVRRAAADRLVRPAPPAAAAALELRRRAAQRPVRDPGTQRLLLRRPVHPSHLPDRRRLVGAHGRRVRARPPRRQARRSCASASTTSSARRSSSTSSRRCTWLPTTAGSCCRSTASIRRAASGGTATPAARRRSPTRAPARVTPRVRPGTGRPARGCAPHLPRRRGRRRRHRSDPPLSAEFERIRWFPLPRDARAPRARRRRVTPGLARKPSVRRSVTAFPRQAKLSKVEAGLTLTLLLARPPARYKVKLLVRLLALATVAAAGLGSASAASGGPPPGPIREPAGGGVQIVYMLSAFSVRCSYPGPCSGLPRTWRAPAPDRPKGASRASVRCHHVDARRSCPSAPVQADDTVGSVAATCWRSRLRPLPPRRNAVTVPHPGRRRSGSSARTSPAQPSATATRRRCAASHTDRAACPAPAADRTTRSSSRATASSSPHAVFKPCSSSTTASRKSQTVQAPARSHHRTESSEPGTSRNRSESSTLPSALDLLLRRRLSRILRHHGQPEPQSRAPW